MSDDSMELLLEALLNGASARPDSAHMAVFEKCVKLMESAKLKFKADPSQAKAQFQYLSSDGTVTNMILRVRTSHVLIYAYHSSPAKTDDQKEAAAKLFTELNFKQFVGTWELDKRDGEIRYRVSLPFMGGVSVDSMLRGALMKNIQLTYEVFRSHMPQLTALVGADVDETSSSGRSSSGSSSSAGGGGGEAEDEAKVVVSYTPIPAPMLEAIKVADADKFMRALQESNVTDFTTLGANGVPILTLCCYFDAESICSTLINLGCDLNARDPNGNTALTLACYKKKAGIAILLLNAGANTNCVDSAGETPVFDAVRNGTKTIVELILANKATNLRIKNKRGETVLDVARRSQPDFVPLLLKRFAS